MDQMELEDLMAQEDPTDQEDPMDQMDLEELADLTAQVEQDQIDQDKDPQIPDLTIKEETIISKEAITVVDRVVNKDLANSDHKCKVEISKEVIKLVKARDKVVDNTIQTIQVIIFDCKFYY
jgi:hypothetical protein